METDVDSQQQLASEVPAGTQPPVLSLPEANAFSPRIIILRRVLELVDQNSPDRPSIIEALRREYFTTAAKKRTVAEERVKQQETRAYNVLIGMKGYRLYDLKNNELTDTGKKLLSIRDDDELHETFAAHILKNCHGVDVLRAIGSLRSRGERVTKNSLADELRTQGFKLPTATTHHTRLLQWLRETPVVRNLYDVDEREVARLTGIGLKEIEEWTSLTRQQRVVLRTLRQLGDIHGKTPLSTKYVVDLAIQKYGPAFTADQRRARVFRPLEEDGWVALSTAGPGRGGKSGNVAATDKLLSLDIGIVADTGGLPADLRARQNMSLEEVYKALKSKNTHTKGIGLELLAVRLATALGLTPVRLRVRGRETGGAEVDLIAEGAHLQFSRWLFQCKNTPSTRVPLAALAKEIGMAVLLKAHVIVVVTTGEFASTVVDSAIQVAQTTPLQVVLMDKDVLQRFRDAGPQSVLEFGQLQAAEAMRLKRDQIPPED